MAKTSTTDLDRVTKKWKKWLKDEFTWQTKLRAKVNKISRAAGVPNPPGELPPPPKPPFK
jgi:hypothetical protein